MEVFEIYQELGASENYDIQAAAMAVATLACLDRGVHVALEELHYQLGRLDLTDLSVLAGEGPHTSAESALMRAWADYRRSVG
jgi:hypothetical protein